MLVIRLLNHGDAHAALTYAWGISLCIINSWVKTNPNTQTHIMG
jgi:hypothetical protein